MVFLLPVSNFPWKLAYFREDEKVGGKCPRGLDLTLGSKDTFLKKQIYLKVRIGERLPTGPLPQMAVMVTVVLV